MAVGKSSVGEEGGFGGACDDAFEVEFSLVVEVHGHVELSPEADRLLEHLVLANALIGRLQALADVASLRKGVPSLL